MYCACYSAFVLAMAYCICVYELNEQQMSEVPAHVCDVVKSLNVFYDAILLEASTASHVLLQSDLSKTSVQVEDTNHACHLIAM